MVEVVAQLKHLRMSPKKVRLVAHTLKGLDATEAVSRLQFTNKASAPVLLKLVKSAIASARHNSNIEQKQLFVKLLTVDQAMPLKRWSPAAHGSAHAFKKHGCHIRLVLQLKEGEKVALDSSKTKPTETSVKGEASTETRSEAKKPARKDASVKVQKKATNKKDESVERKEK